MCNFVATDVYALFDSHVKKSATWLCKTEGGGGGGKGREGKKHPIWRKRASLIFQEAGHSYCNAFVPLSLLPPFLDAMRTCSTVLRCQFTQPYFQIVGFVEIASLTFASLFCRKDGGGNVKRGIRKYGCNAIRNPIIDIDRNTHLSVRFESSDATHVLLFAPPPLPPATPGGGAGHGHAPLPLGGGLHQDHPEAQPPQHYCILEPQVCVLLHPSHFFCWH